MPNIANNQIIATTGNSGNKIAAKSKGYFFELNDLAWQLDKNTTTNLKVIHSTLSGDTLEGCLHTLSYYAQYLSPSHTKNVNERFQHFLKQTQTGEISTSAFINYRNSLDKQHEWYLGTIRGFIRKWYELGYEGIDKDVIKLLDSWTLKGNRKGDAVKRLDPEEGPLTDIELQAFNEGVVVVYEKGLISLSELAICLVMSNTGRRPVQISHLKVIDVIEGKNEKGEPTFFLNMPRAKHGDGFRAQLKPFSISEDLHAILKAQARFVLDTVEKVLGFSLQVQDQQKLPLFPDFLEIRQMASPALYRHISDTDMLHISSAAVTDMIQLAIHGADIKSERTGAPLYVNSRRFRYTTGTRAAREGFGELVIAELLDHTDTQNAGVYIKNIPEHVKKLDAAVGFQLAPYAQAFRGVIVDSEREAKRGSDPNSRIRTDNNNGIGTCGEHGFCGANVPIPCYTCMHFQPWIDGPHEEVYSMLLVERERILDLTNDLTVASTLDRSILAVADVIMRCHERRTELEEQGVLDV